MKICSTTLNIRGGRLKPQWDKYIPMRIDEVLKTDATKCWRGFKVKRTLNFASGNVKWHNHFITHLSHSYKSAWAKES